VFNTYGETLTNAQLLARYGFVLDSNDNDVIAWDLEELVDAVGSSTFAGYVNHLDDDDDATDAIARAIDGESDSAEVNTLPSPRRRRGGGDFSAEQSQSQSKGMTSSSLHQLREAVSCSMFEPRAPESAISHHYTISCEVALIIIIAFILCRVMSCVVSPYPQIWAYTERVSDPQLWAGSCSVYVPSCSDAQGVADADDEGDDEGRGEVRTVQLERAEDTLMRREQANMLQTERGVYWKQKAGTSFSPRTVMAIILF
jgi:hypothetical protein